MELPSKEVTVSLPDPRTSARNGLLLLELIVSDVPQTPKY